MKFSAENFFWNVVIIVIDTICLTKIVKLLGDNRVSLLNRYREKEGAKERKKKKET